VSRGGVSSGLVVIFFSPFEVANRMQQTRLRLYREDFRREEEYRGRREEEYRGGLVRR
jgi:hypothetical protein